jgi:hypothetical protein
MANQLNLPSSRQIPCDENLEAKLPGGGGRVQGGTEARAYKRATRRILDANDDAIPSPVVFIAVMATSRMARQANGNPPENPQRHCGNVRLTNI